MDLLEACVDFFQRDFVAPGDRDPILGGDSSLKELLGRFFGFVSEHAGDEDGRWFHRGVLLSHRAQLLP